MNLVQATGSGGLPTNSETFTANTGSAPSQPPDNRPRLRPLGAHIPNALRLHDHLPIGYLMLRFLGYVRLSYVGTICWCFVLFLVGTGAGSFMRVDFLIRFVGFVFI